jgi:hypothetical protein
MAESILVFHILPIFAYRPIQITKRSEQKRLVKIRSGGVGRDTTSFCPLSPIFTISRCESREYVFDFYFIMRIYLFICLFRPSVEI